MPWGAVAGQRDIWPSDAQELLLRAALIPDERALDAWRQVRSRIEVATLDGSTLALLPMLRKNLLALDVEDELLSLFKGVHRYSWARNQTLLAPMMPIVDALGHAGIDTLLLKGAAFVADRRLDAGMRPMNDIDVLVPVSRMREAIDLLLDAGLVPVGGVPPWYVAEYAPRFVPSHGFRDELDHQLDLHWHVLHASCQPEADDDFWAAAAPIELLGVKTRALCPADELLLVILHGLRWNAIPTYRWVLDAALLCSGALGTIDYERLIEQARKRRVTVALRAGLDYLRQVVAAPVPQRWIAALSARRPLVLERLELRAQTTQPRARSALQWGIVYHQQYARRELPLARKPTVARHLGLARRRLGIERARDLRHVFSGGPPGPGRPPSEMAAAVGHGVARTTPLPIALSEPVDLANPDLAMAHSAYGTWRAEGHGCWIAGRQAELVLALSEPASTALVLEISADAFLAAKRPRQRLAVSVNGMAAAQLTIGASEGLREEPVILPREAVGGRERLELRLSVPDAASPARLGLDDDDRQVSVFLRRVLVRAPPTLHLGETLLLGEDGAEQSALIRGWGLAEPSGRWTIGPLAELLLAVDGSARALELEYDAIPFLGKAGRRLQVDVLANGRQVGTVTYDPANPGPSATRLPLPTTRGRAGEDLLLGWRIHDPSSPHALGASEDRRELGVFVRRLVLRERSSV
jgi:hypothetical protein